MAMGLVVAILSGCSHQENKLDLNVQAGNELYLPEDNVLVDLRNGNTTEFYWAPSIAYDNGYVSYDVIFTGQDGSFDNPVDVVSSQFNGSRPYLSMVPKKLQKIARKAGIGNLEEGELKWTVRASKGLGGSIYSETRTIRLHTMNSMDPLPEHLFIYGQALESAESMDELKMTVSRGINSLPAEPGIFESFCKLASGQDFFIKDELDRHYKLDSAGLLVHTQDPVASSINEDDVIWMNIDVDGMSWSYHTVTKIQLYAAAWADETMTTVTKDLEYKGNGTWSLLGYENTNSKNAADDSRYRFNAILGDDTVLYLGTSATLGAEYTVSYRMINFYWEEAVGSVDWDKTFNLLVQDCGKPCDVHLYLNSDNKAGTWWHDIIF